MILKDEAEARRVLVRCFLRSNETQLRIDRYCKELENAVAIMRHLGLTEYEGRRLEVLKAQLAYQARAFFRRSMSATMKVPGYESYPAGTDHSWGFPKLHGRPEFRLELCSHDMYRTLHVTIDTQSERDSTLFTSGELHTRFQLSDSSRAVQIRLYRRAKKYGPNECVDHNHEREWVARVKAAFEAEGFDGVWRVLDWIWLDIASSRPMTRPLKPLSLEARYGPHNGQAVKVFGPAQTVAGVWQHTVRKTDGTISAVRIVPVGKPNTSIEIPASEIFELLPCRPGYEV